LRSVDPDVRLADGGVRLPVGDAGLDVGTNRPRRGRLAVGDRKAFALGTLELLFEVRRARRGRRISTRPEHDCQCDEADRAHRDPRTPATDQPLHRATARNFSRSATVLGPYFDATTSPLGDTAIVSG